MLCTPRPPLHPATGVVQCHWCLQEWVWGRVEGREQWCTVGDGLALRRVHCAADGKHRRIGAPRESGDALLAHYSCSCGGMSSGGSLVRVPETGWARALLGYSTVQRSNIATRGEGCSAARAQRARLPSAGVVGGVRKAAKKYGAMRSTTIVGWCFHHVWFLWGKGGGKGGRKIGSLQAI